MMIITQSIFSFHSSTLPKWFSFLFHSKRVYPNEGLPSPQSWLFLLPYAIPHPPRLSSQLDFSSSPRHTESGTPLQRRCDENLRLYIHRNIQEKDQKIVHRPVLKYPANLILPRLITPIHGMVSQCRERVTFAPLRLLSESVKRYLALRFSDTLASLTSVMIRSQMTTLCDF